MCQKRIEIKNVSVTFPNGARVLDEVSLVLPEGTRTVVIGESGSGKSVMLAALLGILPAGAGVSGSFYLDGEDLFLLPEKKMEKIRGRKLGYIPQGSGNSLNPLLKEMCIRDRPYLLPSVLLRDSFHTVCRSPASCLPGAGGD